ncbi:MAG: hypothetical protein AAF496_00715 [Pseudomonadota bacterium]
MSLRYDFDIVRTPMEDSDTELTESEADMGRVVHALFRDIKTADALRGASPGLRRMFQNAGFGLGASNSGIAHGVFAPDDTPDRDRILAALFAEIKAQGVAGEYTGEFDLVQFVQQARNACPAAGVIPARTTPSRARPAEVSPPKRRAVPGRIGFALGLAVLVFAALKYLAETGANP